MGCGIAACRTSGSPGLTTYRATTSDYRGHLPRYVGPPPRPRRRGRLRERWRDDGRPSQRWARSQRGAGQRHPFRRRPGDGARVVGKRAEPAQCGVRAAVAWDASALVSGPPSVFSQPMAISMRATVASSASVHRAATHTSRMRPGSTRARRPTAAASVPPRHQSAPGQTAVRRPPRSLQLAVLPAQQTHGLRRLAQMPHRQHVVLAAAVPRHRDVQLVQGRAHLGRRQVAGFGQPDAVVADPVQQPGLGEGPSGPRPRSRSGPTGPAVRRRRAAASAVARRGPRRRGRDRPPAAGAGQAHGRPRAPDRRRPVRRHEPYGAYFGRTDVAGSWTPGGSNPPPGPPRPRRPDRPGEQLAKPDLDLTGPHPGDRGLELGQDLALSHGTAVPLDIRVRILAARHASTLPAAAPHLHPARVKM